MRKTFRVCKDVYTIGGPEISDTIDCCIYMLDAKPSLILIDTGAGRSFLSILKNINLLGFDSKNIKAVVVTHAHIDHIGALFKFKKELNAKIIAHEEDSYGIETGKRIGAEFYGVDYEPCEVDIKIRGSEYELCYGSHPLKVIHIPGHTEGSIAAYVDIEGERILFGQDVHGPYMEELGSDVKKAKESLKKLIELKADILCEGHFGIYQTKKKVKKYIEGYLFSLN